MSKRLCVNCMKGFLDENRKCDTCGVVESDIQTSQRHLPPRTILRGKYLVGKVIGEGGFGITYLGYDLDLDICVAIKEFCPRDYAGREMTNGLTITPFDSDSARFFELEKSKFINEAKRLAKFRGEQGIVSVQDYFQENETAYIVMEYIEGITLKKYLQSQDKLISVDTVLSLMKPIMQSLGKMHVAGIIHRDISPDNIMISNDGKQVYLIDFGTAREAAAEGERSLSVYKKSGYTPIEQQSTTGNQGAWTDVYAMCATIYRCISNHAVPEATERLLGEELIKPSALGVSIDSKVEQALLHGLAVKPDERTRNMEQLIGELTDASAEKSQELQQPKEENKLEKVEIEEKKVEEKARILNENANQSVIENTNQDSSAIKKEGLQKKVDTILKTSKKWVMFWMMVMYGMSIILSDEYGAFINGVGGIQNNDETIFFGMLMWCIPIIIELILVCRKKVYEGVILSVTWIIFWTWQQSIYELLERSEGLGSITGEYIGLHIVIFAIGWAIIAYIWHTNMKEIRNYQNIMNNSEKT